MREGLDIHLAILRGAVEYRSVGAYLGSLLGSSEYLDDLMRWGYIEPVRYHEDGEDKKGWQATEAGRELYERAGLREAPTGRWYFHADWYKWPSAKEEA